MFSGIESASKETEKLFASIIPKNRPPAMSDAHPVEAFVALFRRAPV